MHYSADFYCLQLDSFVLIFYISNIIPRVETENIGTIFLTFIMQMQMQKMQHIPDLIFYGFIYSFLHPFVLVEHFSSILILSIGGFRRFHHLTHFYLFRKHSSIFVCPGICHIFIQFSCSYSCLYFSCCQKIFYLKVSNKGNNVLLSVHDSIYSF